MKDALGHGSNPRSGAGQFQSSTGVTRAAREKAAINRMVDQRRFAQGRTSNRGKHMMAQFVLPAGIAPHMRGIHTATSGKTLAQTSAMGATTATINKPEG